MLEIADRCNESCVHCYQVHGQRGELSTAEWMRVIDELAELGVLFLTFSGGEPTLRKDFLELVAHARRRRFAVKVYSNALNIDDALARALGELAVQEVQISLYSHEPSRHDAVTRVPGSFARVLAATRSLRRSGVRVLLKTPLMTTNADALDEYMALAQSLDADFAFDPHLNPREDGDFSPRALAIDKAAYLALRRDPRLRGPGPQARDLSAAPCGACANNVHVEADGELRPCTQWAVPTGDARREPLARAWRENANANAIRALTWADLPGCRACDLRDYCQRCFADARAEVGSPLLPYPMACRGARWHYEARHGAAPRIAGGSETSQDGVGPYRRVGEHTFERVAFALEALDRERMQSFARLSPASSNEGPLVTLRRRRSDALRQPTSTPSE